MRQVFCPRLIGRADELRVITDALDSASGKNPRGQALFLVGEAGVGKSRLTHEAEELAGARQLRTLRGRSVEGGQGGAGAFRPLVEALLSALRQEPLPASIPELRPFQPILARLIPEWRERGATPIEESLVLLSEAVLRLLKVLGSPAGYRGCLLVLEDLHWADSETVAVIEYLAANVSSEPLVIVATTRPEQSSHALRVARLMSAQRLGTLIELERLSAGDVAVMASACLNGAPVPERINRLLASTADGLPLLVEDLLAAWTDGGALVCEAGTWQVQRSIEAVVPLSFAETVRGRLRRIGPDARRILQLAALLGRRFEWTLLPGASGVDSEGVLEALRVTVEAQLVIALPTGFAFRHALTRDAVLQDLLPVERARDAARLLDLIEAAHPDLEGEWRELAAMLAEIAGDRLRAARLLLQAGRDLLESGALVSAEQTLEHARALAGPASEIRVEVGHALLEVFAQSGQYERATEIGLELLRELDTYTPRRGSESLAKVHLTMAAAAVAASQIVEANHHLAAARALDLNAELEARVAALAAHIAIDQRRVAEAARLATAALEAAERGEQIDVGCEALIVLGRLARGHDLDRAAEAFERALALAHAHGKTIWETRALHELGTIDMFRGAAPDRLLEARALALDRGALATAAWVEGELAALFNTRFEMTRSLDYANSALAAARRYHLVGVEAMSLAFVAEVHAYRQDRAAVERTRVEMQALGFDDPFIEEVAWECRAITSLLAENRQRAARELEQGVAILRTNAASAPSPLLALWVLLELVEHGDAGDHREELRHSSSMVNLTNRGYLAYADAVASARSGEVAVAEGHVMDGDQTLRVAPWYFHYGRRLLAEAAIRDGWGEPVEWLRGAEAFFAEHQYDAVASACRSLLRKAGAGAGRPRVHRGVPPAFREYGITEREIEVLSILATGLSNREIGARLYVSPKTVEKHVASLMDKLNVRTRAQLATLAAAQLGVDVTRNWGISSM